MPNNPTNSDNGLRDGLYRVDHADSDIFLPGSLWKPSIRTLGDYIKNLCSEPTAAVTGNANNTAITTKYGGIPYAFSHTGYYEPITTADNQRDQSDQSDQSDQPIYAETDGSYTITVNIPVSRFTTTFDPSNCADYNPIVTASFSSAWGEGQSREVGDSIIPRANCQAGANSAKLVPVGGHQSINSEGNIDAQPDDDGSANGGSTAANTP